MKTAIYIHGLGGSANGSSAHNVRESLASRYLVNAFTYDLLRPLDAFERISRDSFSADLIIASSLGAFYASALETSAPRLLLNPCWEPWSTIPGILYPEQRAAFDEETCLAQWQDIRRLRQLLPVSAHDTTFAVFADRDELFSFKSQFHDEFCPSPAFSPNYTTIHATHEIAKTPAHLSAALDAALSFLSR